MLDNNLKDILIKKALKSDCRYKISAIGFDRKGNYIGSANNKARFRRKGGGIHAEEGLIKRYKRTKSIIICRVNSKGVLKPIDPCEKCLKLMEKMGVRFYTLR